MPYVGLIHGVRSSTACDKHVLVYDELLARFGYERYCVNKRKCEITFLQHLRQMSGRLMEFSGRWTTEGGVPFPRSASWAKKDTS